MDSRTSNAPTCSDRRPRAQHVRVHWQMLRWAWRHRDAREFFGQLLRIRGAATKTFIGLVPAGNTGGANVSAVRPMPLDPELAAIIETALRVRGPIEGPRVSVTDVPLPAVAQLAQASRTRCVRRAFRRSPETAPAAAQ